MVESVYGTQARARNPDIHEPVRHEAPVDRRGSERPSRFAQKRPSAEAGTADAILDVIDDAGVISLDALVRALPGLARPITAVARLVDAGLIEMEGQRAFDGDVRIRRSLPLRP